MKITNAKYLEKIEMDGTRTGVMHAIEATIDSDECIVPTDSDNRHYIEILKQVDAGTLTIQDAE